MEDVVEIEFTVEKELYYKESSNWGSYACRPTVEYWDDVKLNTYGNISINGVMPRLEIWSTWKAELIEQPPHEKYGVSYKVKRIFQDLPQSIDEQKKYLETILTQNQVDAIYNSYEGQDVLQLFKDDKIDHKKLKGFGQHTLDRVRNKVLDNLELHEALVGLADYNLSFAAVSKLVKEYGSAQLVIQEIKKNPYVLCRISGFGFKKVDPIAIKAGYDREGEYRIHSAIKYIIGEDQQSGNSYIKIKELYDRCKELLSICGKLIHEELKQGNIKGVLVLGDKVTLEKTYRAEEYIAKKLLGYQECSEKINFNVDKFLDEEQKENKIELTDQQKKFFYNFVDNNVNFLIGYAGCGKSFLTSILLRLMKKANLSFEFLAPTGKAAKVSSSYTGEQASTIHRAVGIFDDDEEAKHHIFTDVIIVDEASMVDVYVLSKLLSKLSVRKPKLLFVGDDFQLPSVQVGNFLFDSINSGKFSVTRLTNVFRQKDGGILDIATNIREKQKFVDSDFLGKKKFGSDAILHSVKQKYMIQGYQYYYKEALKKYSKEDITIVSPTKKGKLGTFEINKMIQEIANPPSDNKKEYKYGKETIFRVGDNVINIQNTYKVKDQSGNKVNIVNGDMGKIIDIDEDRNKMVIDYDFAVVDVPFDQVGNILHSYCLTIHKMQGSSSKVLIMIADISHKYPLNANLLYTGTTRASEFMYLLSQGETINHGMKKNLSMERNSFLGELLVSY